MKMTSQATAPFEFVLSAEDHDLACSVLQMRFILDDAHSLVALIPGAQSDDPYLWQRSYDLEEAAWRRIAEVFAIPFDTAALGDRSITVCIWRTCSVDPLPYQIHTGYELLFLLNGHKKLAKMSGGYPPLTFQGEDAFDRWVEAGTLHREEVIEPFEKPHRRRHGHRTVYYTPKGEEWRIPAMKLLWEASTQSGGGMPCRQPGGRCRCAV